MLILAIACFVLAALLGLFLLGYVLGGKPTPKAVALMHGPVGAVGIALLLFAWATDRPVPMLSLGLFIAVAMGGFFLIFRDLSRGRVPKTIALGHGILAAIALTVLVLFVVRGPA